MFLNYLFFSLSVLQILITLMNNLNNYILFYSCYSTHPFPVVTLIFIPLVH